MDNQEKYLKTTTNPIKGIIGVWTGAGTMGVLGLFLGGLGNSWGYGLLVCGIALVTGALGCWISSKNKWKIIFRNRTITVTGRSYDCHLDTLKAYDFTFKQTPSQKAKNRGDLWVKGLSYNGREFPLADVENFSEVKKYIEENF